MLGVYQNLLEFTTRNFQLTLHSLLVTYDNRKKLWLNAVMPSCFFGRKKYVFYVVTLNILMRKIALADFSKVMYFHLIDPIACGILRLLS